MLYKEKLINPIEFEYLFTIWVIRLTTNIKKQNMKDEEKYISLILITLFSKKCEVNTVYSYIC